MAFRDIPEQTQGVALLQRSLKRGRLGHAYLFTGGQLEKLEALARTLAKTLNCHNPVKAGGVTVDCCDECLSCRKIEGDTHADVFWLRPESKLRQIRIGQITRRSTSPPRVLMEMVNLKPTEGEFKVCIVSAADRMNEDAGNSLLKTLEEPPQKSVLILLSAEPQRLLETIRSRCLRLSFDNGGVALNAAQLDWLRAFSEVASAEQKSLLARYRLLDSLVQKLAEMKERVQETIAAKSPLEKYDEVEASLREKWEDELAAAVEAEYRRQRGELLAALQWWLRDVWLRTLKVGEGLLQLPELAGTASVARRITPTQAMDNLGVLEQTQRLLHTNVQEALTLEVGLLKLKL